MTATLEEYLKTIYILLNKKSIARVTDIAQEIGCSKPSVNRAVKVLKQSGYVEYKAYGDIKLTPKGAKEAERIIRFQLAIESFLTDILNVEADRANEEANIMRHAISEDTVEKFESYVKKFIDLKQKECQLYDPKNKKCINCTKKRNSKCKNEVE